MKEGATLMPPVRSITWMRVLDVDQIQKHKSWGIEHNFDPQSTKSLPFHAAVGWRSCCFKHLLTEKSQCHIIHVLEPRCNSLSSQSIPDSYLELSRYEMIWKVCEPSSRMFLRLPGDSDWTRCSIFKSASSDIPANTDIIPPRDRYCWNSNPFQSFVHHLVTVNLPCILPSCRYPFQRPRSYQTASIMTSSSSEPRFLHYHF